MKIAIFGAALLLAIAGCATYSQPGKSDAEFRRDAYERDAAPVADGFAAYSMRHRCMLTKGWRSS